jgi:tellurite resistance protein TerB
MQRTEKTGVVMAERYTHSSTTTALDLSNEQVMHGLITAGAVVALADGRVDAIERDELVNFIDRQQLVPTIPKHDIGEAFDQRVRQLKDRDSAKVIMESLRPLVGLSLASVVVRIAERVAAADRPIYPSELQALELIRLIMTCPPPHRCCQSLLVQ